MKYKLMLGDLKWEKQKKHKLLISYLKDGQSEKPVKEQGFLVMI